MNGINGKLTGFQCLTEAPATFTLTEFDMDVPALPAGANVYWEEDVAVVATFTGPGGKTLRVDGFYYEEQEMAEDGGWLGAKDTPPRFRVRVSFPTAGDWAYEVTLAIGGAPVDGLSGTVLVTESGKSSRILRVEPKARRTFMTDDGVLVPPIGEDVGWKYPPVDQHLWGPYMVDIFKKLAAHGANWTRIWDYMDSGGKVRKTMTTFYQCSSAKWDQVFEAAEELDVYISFVLINHGEISETVDARFDGSVWHVNQGGCCVNGEDFFLDRRAVDAFKSYCRYIVARWGYSQHAVWELCNEIDHSTGMRRGYVDEVRAWIREITACLKERDPYGHLVTNSAGFASVSVTLQEPCLDFMYFHVYNNLSSGMLRDMQENARRAYGCPVMLGEYGFDGPSQATFTSRLDEIVVTAHLGNWAGLFGGAAGTDLNWFWMFMDDANAYHVYDGVSNMAKRLPLDDPALRSIDHTVAVPQNGQLGLMGYGKENAAYLWVYDAIYQPLRQVETPFAAEPITLPLQDGVYTATWYDTRTDAIVLEESVTAQNGAVTVTTPAFTKDIAVIIR